MKLLIPLLLALVPACITPAAVVGFASVAGNGDVRSDTTVLVALGELQGDAGVFVKGSGFPLTLPLNTASDEWLAMNRDTKETRRGKLGVDPLPSWVGPLYRPGELETIGSRLGYEIVVE